MEVTNNMERCIFCKSENILVVTDNSKSVIKFSEISRVKKYKNKSICLECNRRWLGTEKEVLARLRKEESYYFRNKMHDKSIRVNKIILMIDPDNSVALHNIGANFFAINNKKRALDYFMQAIEKKPQNSTSYYMAGLIYEEWKEYSLAAKCFDLAIVSDEVQSDEELLNAALKEKDKTISKMDLYHMVDYYFNSKKEAEQSG
jgi:tetratricopeptide (TPR) repeat protein